MVLVRCLSAPKTDIGGGQMGRNCGKRKISCRTSVSSVVLALAAGPKTAISPALCASFKVVSAPSKIGTATGRRGRFGKC